MRTVAQSYSPLYIVTQLSLNKLGSSSNQPSLAGNTDVKLIELNCDEAYKAECALVCAGSALAVEGL